MTRLRTNIHMFEITCASIRRRCVRCIGRSAILRSTQRESPNAGYDDFRAVIESRWYKSAFPETRVGTLKNSESEIEFTARGSRLATSVGGTLTGRGGGIIIIDDPLKPDDARSEPQRCGLLRCPRSA